VEGIYAKEKSEKGEKFVPHNNTAIRAPCKKGGIGP